MINREVKSTGKGEDGIITKLCISGEYLSPRTNANAVSDVESGKHNY